MTPGAVLDAAAAAGEVVPRKIVIRGQWSMKTLGSRLYLPAAFKLIQRNLPLSEIFFWPYTEDEVVLNKIKMNITRFNLLNGNLDDPYGELTDTLRKADIIFHFGGILSGNGNSPDPAGLSDSANLFDFCEQNKILYALHSLRISPGFTFDDPSRKILNNASFVFSSYPVDGKKLSNSGIENRNFDFAPDATYYFDLNENNLAGQYLNSNNLNGTQYLVLSLRSGNEFKESVDLEKHISKFAHLIDSWISGTGNPVLLLIGNKDDSEFLAGELVEPLPEKSKNKVVVLDEISDPSVAISIIDKSRVCIGNDPYPLMMSVSSRVPVIFTRTSETDPSYENFTSLSMDDRILDLNDTGEKELVNTLFDLNKNYLDSLVVADQAAKLLSLFEKKSFKPLDKQLGVRKKSRPTGKK